MALWQQIVDVLKEQMFLYQAMFELAEKKSQLVVDGKVRELEKLVLAEENLLTQGGKLELHRQELQEKLKDSLALHTEQLTLRLLIEHAPREWRPVLTECEEGLLQSLEQLGRQNQLNGQLLENALRLVNYQLSILEPDASGMQRRAYLDRKA